MRKPLILTVILPILLVGCGSTMSAGDPMGNPLYAERYHDDMVEQMVDLVLQNDPLTKDDAMSDIIEDTRVDSLRAAEDANDEQDPGLHGQIVSDFEYAIGEVLLLDGTLYIGPDFETKPGPDLHAYLTDALDPRDAGTFPSAATVDLGTVKNNYGIYGFAQLSGR
jgi:hypothetical protein